MGTRYSHRDRDAAMDILIQSDRVYKEARMLPTGRPLTTDEHELVRAALHRLMKERQDAGEPLAITAIAAAIGYSTSAVSTWIRHCYRGDEEKVTRAINIYVERQTRRSETEAPRDYVETWVCEEMMAFVRMADRHRKMAAITAPPGSGKDKVIEILADQLGAYVVQCSKQTTPKQLIMAIGVAIGGKAIRRGANDEMMRAIVERLKDRSCLIFLNEAQQLVRDCASVIRFIYDESGVPFIMFGSSNIFQFIDDRASGDGQFWRRCFKLNITNLRQVVADPDNPEKAGRPLFTKKEIKAFLDRRQVRLNKDAIELVWQVAQLEAHGTLGLAMDVVGVAASLYPTEPLTRDMILEALELAQDDEYTQIYVEVSKAEDLTPAAAKVG